MPVSVRMDPLLERELESAAKRQGVTKSQFIIDAVHRAWGRKNPYELMLKLKAEEEREWVRSGRALPKPTPSYDSETARAVIVKRLKAKHGIGSAG